MVPSRLLAWSPGHLLPAPLGDAGAGLGRGGGSHVLARGGDHLVVGRHVSFLLVGV